MLQLVSVQTFCLVLSQDLLDSFQTLFGNVVEGSAALADVMALQGHSGLDDGVGVAVLEGLLQDSDRVLSGLCALEVASLEAVVDLCNSGRPDVGAACNAACAALFQAGQDRAVVAGEDGNVLVQLTGQADVSFQVLDVAAGILLRPRCFSTSRHSACTVSGSSLLPVRAGMLYRMMGRFTAFATAV